MGVTPTLAPYRRSACAARQTPGVARSRDMCALGGHKFRVMVLAPAPVLLFLSVDNTSLAIYHALSDVLGLTTIDILLFSERCSFRSSLR
jgi:hypothetical protein